MELNRITNLESGHGDGRGISADVSWLNQGDGGGTGFRDIPAAVDGSSNKIHAAC